MKNTKFLFILLLILFGIQLNAAPEEKRRRRPRRDRARRHLENMDPYSIIRNGNFSDSKERPTNWVTWGSSTLGEFTILPPEKDNPSNILRVKCNKKDRRPWNLQLRQSFIPQLQANNTLYLSFEYRTTPGYICQMYLQKEAPPWPKFLAYRLQPTNNEWLKSSFSIVLQQTYQSRKSSLSFHLAETPGTIEFRDIRVSVYPPGESPKEWESTFTPVLDGDFFDNDWRNKVKGRLLSVRKNKCYFQLSNDDIEIDERVKIKIHQKNRDFLFGVILPESLATDYDHLQKMYPQYLNNKLFNWVVSGTDFRWKEMESISREKLQDTIAKLKESGKVITAHNILTPAYQYLPTRLKTVDSYAFTNELSKYYQKNFETFGNNVDFWEVLNSPISNTELYDKISETCLLEAFQIPEGLDQNKRYVLSDEHALTKPERIHLEELVAMIKWLKMNNIEPYALSFSVDMEPPLLGPQEIESRITWLEEQLQLPIYINKLAVKHKDPKMQVHCLKDLLYLFYSCSSVKGVAIDGTSHIFYNADRSPNLAGKMLKGLCDEWQINKTITTDQSGFVQTVLFHGDYTLTFKYKGKIYKHELKLRPSNEPEVAIEIPLTYIDMKQSAVK